VYLTIYIYIYIYIYIDHEVYHGKRLDHPNFFTHNKSTGHGNSLILNYRRTTIYTNSITLLNEKKKKKEKRKKKRKEKKYINK